MTLTPPRHFVLPLALIFSTAPALADRDVGMRDYQGVNGPAQENLYIAETPEEWERLWALVGEAPKASFEKGKHTGVGIFLGTRPKGESLKGRKAQDDDGRLELKVTWKRNRAQDGGETETPWMIALINETGSSTVVDFRVKAQDSPE